MPYPTPTACCYPGCRNTFVGPGSYCPEHVAERAHEKNLRDYGKRKDDPIKKLYNGADWKRTRAGYLAANPMCLRLEDNWQGSGKVQCTQPATELHHLIDPHERPDLFYTWSNLRGLCKHHHHKHQGEAQSDPHDYVAPVLFAGPAGYAA